MHINLKTIIFIILLFVPIFLLCWINPPVTLWGTIIFIVYVVAVVGWYFYASLKSNIRFHADFSDPNDQQYALVQEYVKEVKRDIEKAKFFTDYWVLLFVGITGLYFFIRLSMEAPSGIDLVIDIVLGISFIVMYFFGNMLSCSRAVKRVNYKDFEIARVEYFDVTHFKDWRTHAEYYYLYVRSHGKTQKVSIAPHVYQYLQSHLGNEGYLIKAGKGRGIFGKYDFVPERKGRY